jgi:hypothetical protein
LQFPDPLVGWPGNRLDAGTLGDSARPRRELTCRQLNLDVQRLTRVDQVADTPREARSQRDAARQQPVALATKREHVLIGFVRDPRRDLPSARLKQPALAIDLCARDAAVERSVDGWRDSGDWKRYPPGRAGGHRKRAYQAQHVLLVIALREGRGPPEFPPAAQHARLIDDHHVRSGDHPARARPHDRDPRPDHTR